MKKGFILPLVIVTLVIVAAIIGVGLYIGKKISSVQPQSTVISNSVASPVPSPTPDVTANWKTYTNAKYNFSFKYPSAWNVTYDQQPDPAGNPDKYSILMGDSSSSLSITILKSNQSQTFASLSNLLNLPSGSATITSRKEISVAGSKALFVTQDNNKVGALMLNSSGNIIILETASTNMSILDQIISTFKFTN